jgi:hypothetical protein
LNEFSGPSVDQDYESLIPGDKMNDDHDSERFTASRCPSLWPMSCGRLLSTVFEVLDLDGGIAGVEPWVREFLKFILAGLEASRQDKLLRAYG